MTGLDASKTYYRFEILREPISIKYGLKKDILSVDMIEIIYDHCQLSRIAFRGCIAFALELSELEKVIERLDLPYPDLDKNKAFKIKEPEYWKVKELAYHTGKKQRGLLARLTESRAMGGAFS